MIRSDRLARRALRTPTEPAAAVVRLNDVFKKNAVANVTNADWKWRPGVTKVSFFVTDEYNNDWTRYFSTANNP